MILFIFGDNCSQFIVIGDFIESIILSILQQVTDSRIFSIIATTRFDASEGDERYPFDNEYKQFHE